MRNIKWGRILIVILVIVAISRWRAIRALIAEMDLGGTWSAFCATLRDMPSGGKYVVVLAVLALLYISIYRLIVYRNRQGK